ncbi:MAG: AIR synthase related protein, partial [Dehalococcoidia bacterium]
GSLPDVRPDDATAALLRLLARPNIASKRGVYRTYDQQVLNNTVIPPGGDAAVLRVWGTERGIALKTDGNGRYCYLDPYNGAAIAVAECARNIVCTGAVPVAVTDCLNFGNPEKPDVYYQLSQAVHGIAEACSVFETPVVSGNVSLYNETAGRAIYPTPVIGMLGVLEDVSKHLRAGFNRPGADVWLLGAAIDQPVSTLGGSEYLEAEHGRVAGLPTVDLQAERRLQQLVLRLNDEGLLLSAHDCSDGGLAVTLAECSILGDIGFEGRVDVAGRLDAGLFGEGQGRIVVSSHPDSFRQGGGVGRIQDLARELAVPATRIGRTVPGSAFSFGPISTTIPALLRAYESLIR